MPARPSVLIDQQMRPLSAASMGQAPHAAGLLIVGGPPLYMALTVSGPPTDFGEKGQHFEAALTRWYSWMMTHLKCAGVLAAEPA